MKWCCMGFEGNFQMAGERGFGVFVYRRDGQEACFILQHRAVDQGVVIATTERPVSMVSDIQVQFCPWCGVKLSDFYRNRLLELDRSELRIAVSGPSNR